MKKVTAIILALLLAVSLVACGSSSDNTKPADKATESAAPSTEPAVVGSGTVGDYAVTISGFSLTKDYEGKPAIVVTYNWTNNSEDTTSFAVSIHAQTFQGGIECENAIIMDDSVYSADNYMKDIKPGASLDVQLAYVLQDSTSPVDVEVTELISFNDDEMITQTFDIAQ